MATAELTDGAREHFVDSSGDVRVAAYELGDPDRPVVVMVHGWPDSHVVWDGVAALLAQKFRIIRYDNRGVGKTSAPKRVSEYSMARYADDFGAVIDALAPGQRVHVLAHDWGSAAVWEYLSRPGADDRVASFTSVSGPCRAHVNSYIKGNLARPYRPMSFLRALGQLLRFSYMALFSIPLVGPLSVRVVFAPAIRRMLVVRDGIPADRVHQSDSFTADAVKSLKVYGANYLPTLTAASTDFYVKVPVQVIVNEKDPFVRPHLYDEIARWVPRLWRRDLKSGHWAPLSHPQVLADAVSELADFLHGKPPARALLRAQVDRRRDYFGDTLVSVTGAGSGIGRETALAFAREGAELVVSDIDEASAKDTAAQIAARGGIAHAYRLDVSDAEAVEQFADEVCATHGVPDIVVNNAGVGQAGSFLDTPRAEWERVLDVNLGGVVNGCRSFARRMVERGTGGHVVNVASMASYAPLQSLNAYCTSKAAVYMFSDCLRAELDSAGIGLTTICPSTVDTNIVQSTRFTAPDGKAHEIPGRQGQLVKMFQLRRYGPDKAAGAIVSAVKKNKPIRPVMPEAYFVYGVSRVLPQALRSVARGRVI